MIEEVYNELWLHVTCDFVILHMWGGFWGHWHFAPELPRFSLITLHTHSKARSPQWWLQLRSQVSEKMKIWNNQLAELLCEWGGTWRWLRLEPHTARPMGAQLALISRPIRGEENRSRKCFRTEMSLFVQITLSLENSHFSILASLSIFFQDFRSGEICFIPIGCVLPF